MIHQKNIAMYRLGKLPTIGVGLLVLIALGSALYQMPPKNTINDYEGHPLQILLHVIPAAILMLIGPLQFMPKFRKKYPAVHRVAGRIFIGCTLFIGITAITMAFTFPYANRFEHAWYEQVPMTIFALLFIWFGIQGTISARKKRFEQHREQMIRVFSLALGAAVFRVMVLTFIMVGLSVKLSVLLTFWLSFSSALLVGEYWIRYNRKLRSRFKPFSHTVSSKVIIDPETSPHP